MTENEITLGVLGYFVARFVQALSIPLVALALIVIIPTATPAGVLWVCIWAVVFAVAMVSQWNLAMITANNEGLRIRRITGEYLVPWSDVCDLRYSMWTSPRLRISLTRPFGRWLKSHTVRVPFYPSSTFLDWRLSLGLKEPAEVQWLRQRIGTGPSLPDQR